MASSKRNTNFWRNHRGRRTNGLLPFARLGWAGGLNLAYLAAMIVVFHWTFNICKERGLLVRVGE